MMQRPLLWLALVCHLFFATGYLLMTPTFEGPDESEHFRSAWYLANARRLPACAGFSGPDDTPLDIDPRGNQGPLYYFVLGTLLATITDRDTVFAFELNDKFATGAPLHVLHGGDEPTSPGRTLLLRLRALSVLLGLVTIVLVHRLGLITCPERPRVADAAAWLLACSPMWSFQHGVLSNDNLAIPLSTAALVVMAPVALGGAFSKRRAAVLGTLCALALLSKITAVFLFAVVVGTVFLALRRAGASVRSLAPSLAVFALATALVAGPWVVRNQILYGDPLAIHAHDSIYPLKIPRDLVWHWVMFGFPQQLFESFVGRFGWFALRPHPAMNVAGAILAIAAIVGLAMLLRRRATPRPAAFLFGACAVQFASIVWFNFSQPQPQARLVAPAIGPAAVLFAAGLLRFGDLLPRGVQLGWWIARPVIAAVVLFFWFAPVFDPAHAPAERHRASIITGLRADVVNPEIEWVAPLPTSPSSSPPTLHWVDRRPVPDAVYSLYVLDDSGRVWLAGFEWGYPAQGGTFTMPDGAWAFVPRNRDVLLQLRRVPDWRAGERLETTSASAPLRFRRS